MGVWAAGCEGEEAADEDVEGVELDEAEYDAEEHLIPYPFTTFEKKRFSRNASQHGGNA